MENSSLKRDQNKTESQEEQEKEKQKLIQRLDLQHNINKCQQITIEKLENKMLILETEKNEEHKIEENHTLEKAQQQRKIASYENQLRFQTNLNDETKKELHKLDAEFS